MAKGGFPGRMGGGGGNMQQMMKQAQQMQAKLGKLQEELEAREFEAQSGGGMVSVKVSGKLDIIGIKIDPKVVDPDDVEMLEDMVLAAIKEAQRIASETTETEMGKLTGGMNLGGLM